VVIFKYREKFTFLQPHASCKTHFLRPTTTELITLLLFALAFYGHLAKNERVMGWLCYLLVRVLFYLRNCRSDIN